MLLPEKDYKNTSFAKLSVRIRNCFYLEIEGALGHQKKWVMRQ